MKTIKLLGIAAMAISMCMNLSSCGSDDALDDTDIDRGDEPSVDNGTPLSQDDQVDKLEKVGKEFMSYFGTSEYKTLQDLYDDLYNEYSEYKTDELEDWADDCFDALTKTSLGSSSITEKDYYTYIYNYKDTYKYVIAASNYTGHFKAQGGKWKKEEGNYDDLQFTCTDKSGNTIIANAKASGSVAQVFVSDDEDWDDASHTYTNKTFTYNNLIREKYYINVPKTVTVTLTKAGETLVTTTLNVQSLSNIDDKPDLSVNYATFTCETHVLGYEVNVAQASYTPGGNLGVSCSISKDDKALVKVAVSASNVSATSSDDEVEIESAKNASVTVNILGQLQVKGTCTDVKALVDYLEEMDDNDENETKFKAALDKANKLLDASIYYDGGSTKQAYLRLDAAVDKWYKGEEWYCEPVIVFGNGSSYSTFESYFNEDTFKSLVKTFEDLMDDYEDLIDDIEK